MNKYTFGHAELSVAYSFAKAYLWLQYEQKNHSKLATITGECFQLHFEGMQHGGSTFTRILYSK